MPSLFATESVTNLELEYRVANVGVCQERSVVARSGLEGGRGTLFVHTREVAGVTQANLQAAGNLVAEAAYIANNHFVQVVRAGVLSLLRVYAASLNEIAVVQYEATLWAKLNEEALAIFANVVAQHDRYIKVAESALQRAAAYLEVVNRSTFLRVKEFRLNREIVRNTEVYKGASSESSFVFRAFRVSTREG